MTPQIALILGSTRQGRLGQKVAAWANRVLTSVSDTQITFVDLLELNLPLFDSATPPSALNHQYSYPAVQEWSKIVSNADAFLFITPEYNHGYPAVLKNALDWLYPEWNYKPATCVSYSISPIGGARAVEQLRQVFIELQLIPLRQALHLASITQLLDNEGNFNSPESEPRLLDLVAKLSWWANVMTPARQTLNP
jgi:NAD(P)H-dependent FMN reductase